MKKLPVVLLVLLLFFFRYRSVSSFKVQEGDLVKITGFLSEEPSIFGNQQKLKIGQFQIYTKRYL